MLATDPLSLVFVSCIVFSGAFLVLSSLLGLGHGHAPHVGHAAGHVAHVGHVGHAGPLAHGGQPSHQAAPPAPPAPVSPWQSFSAAVVGALSLYGALMFLLVFGLAGYLLHNAAHTGALLAILLPIFLAAAVAVGTSALLRQLFEGDGTGELTATNSQIEGQLGTVTMAIRAGGVGEVVFTNPNRGRQSVSARSDDGQAIPAGAQIVILSYEQGIAHVQTWERFLAGTRAPQRSSAPPGEPRA